MGMSHPFAAQVAVAALEAAGYATTWRVVDALALLPQHRDRCYLVGVRRDAGAGAYAWPPLPRVRGRCAAAGAFGRRCPCRRVDGGVGPVALRHALDGVDIDRWSAPHQTSELSSSVTSTSIRLMFGRIDGARRGLEARRKSPVRTVRVRAH